MELETIRAFSLRPAVCYRYKPYKKQLRGRERTFDLIEVNKVEDRGKLGNSAPVTDRRVEKARVRMSGCVASFSRS